MGRGGGGVGLSHGGAAHALAEVLTHMRSEKDRTRGRGRAAATGETTRQAAKRKKRDQEARERGRSARGMREENDGRRRLDGVEQIDGDATETPPYTQKGEWGRGEEVWGGRGREGQDKPGYKPRIAKGAKTKTHTHTAGEHKTQEREGKTKARGRRALRSLRVGCTLTKSRCCCQCSVALHADGVCIRV